MNLLNWCFGILQVFQLVRSVTATHSTICSSSSELEEDRPRVSGTVESLHEILSTCFGDTFPFLPPDSWQICVEGKLQCGRIRQVISIIPSCDSCRNKGPSKQKCYQSQMNATNCALNDYFLPKMKCTKQGRIFSQCQPTYIATLGEHSENTSPDPVSEEPESSEYNSKKDCPPCYTCPKQREQSGLSVGAGVGLLFLGIAIGAIVMGILCICVPWFHSRAQNIKGKVTEKVNKSTLQRSQATDKTLPVQATITVSDGVVPSVPPAAPSQARYHTLDSVNNPRDSHMYTGLQSEYKEPMADSAKYQDTKSQANRGKNTVASPVYQEFTDSIIGESGNAKSRNPPMKKSDTKETSSHNYLVLEAETDDHSINGDVQNYERPLSDHQYFVLEEQNSPHKNEEEEAADDSYHSYFILEKEQK